jgi:glycerate dehydrogenase
MKRSAIVINAARGGIVNEAALAEALNSNAIAAAATDVFSVEPIKADNPLLSVTDPLKTILTPHSAWAPKETIDRLVLMIAANIREFIAACK